MKFAKIYQKHLFFTSFIFYDELKRLSHEFYNGNSLSQDYKNTVSLLTDIEWHAPIHYICYVKDGFIYNDNIITEIINGACKEILYGYLDKVFDYTGYCNEVAWEISGLCQKFGIDHQTIIIDPLFDKMFYSPFEQNLKILLGILHH